MPILKTGGNKMQKKYNYKLKSKSAINEKKYKDACEDYINKFGNWSPQKNTLLDIGGAEHWFELMKWGSENNLYSLQQPFSKKAGNVAYLNGDEYLMISSYDYLGLIGHPSIEEAAMNAISRYGTGTGGVRLLTGSTDLHKEFESELANFKGTEAAITFSSGYLANIGVVAAILTPRDRVIIDSRAHRSITDACRLSRVPLTKFEHNDMNSLESILISNSTARRTLIIVEGVYSMDGDICPLPDVLELKKKYGAYLMVDEAHSFGVLGENGRGINEYYNIDARYIDIWMGSLSKAIPSNGGFLAGAEDLIIYLQHAAAPFMFSAALNPASIAAARESIRILQAEPERLTKLWKNAEYFRNQLKGIGLNTGTSTSQIIPVIFREYETTYTLSKSLLLKGIFASAIGKPAVQPHETRLRICATVRHNKNFIDKVIQGFKEVLS